MNIENQSFLKSQPYTYIQQLYPRVPYYPKNNMKCNKSSECEATGMCKNNICTMRKSEGSVFSDPVVYKFKKYKGTGI